MKKLFKLLLITCISGIYLTSCNDDDQPYYSATMSTYFVTDLKGITSLNSQIMLDTFNTAALLNPANNADYWYYRYGVREVQVTGVSMKITSTNDDFDVINGTLSFYEIGLDTVVVNKTNNTPITQWTMNNTNFKLGQTVIFNNSNNQYEDIANLLYNFDPFGITFEGSTNNNNIQFNCQLLITAKVWINY